MYEINMIAMIRWAKGYDSARDLSIDPPRPLMFCQFRIQGNRIHSGESYLRDFSVSKSVFLPIYFLG